MIVHLEEFRCPRFQIAHDGESHMLFWPSDTIGERIDPAFAMSLALMELEKGRRDLLFERRMLPAVAGKYRPAAPAVPRNIDDQI